MHLDVIVRRYCQRSTAAASRRPSACRGFPEHYRPVPPAVAAAGAPAPWACCCPQLVNFIPAIVLIIICTIIRNSQTITSAPPTRSALGWIAMSGLDCNEHSQARFRDSSPHYAYCKRGCGGAVRALKHTLLSTKASEPPPPPPRPAPPRPSSPHPKQVPLSRAASKLHITATELGHYSTIPTGQAVQRLSCQGLFCP